MSERASWDEYFMQMGLALDAKKRWPGWFTDYRDECLRGTALSRAGSLYARDYGAFFAASADGFPRFILSAATKQHWRSRSTLLDVGQCLANVRAWALRVQPDSLALPALGCGLGGLAWDDVRPMIDRCFDMSQFQGDLMLRTRIIVFAPQ